MKDAGHVRVGPSERDFADLCALADGTLPAARRAEVESRVAASPELQRLLARQRRSLACTQALATEPVPEGLAATVGSAADARRRPRQAEGEGRRTRGPSTGRRRRFALGLSAAALAAVVIAVVVVSVGGPSGPTVAEAAQLALRAPSAPAPAVAASGTQLTAAVDGVRFPNLARTFGWRATGLRTGTIAGRDVVAVSYEKGGRRIGYGIVAGPALERPASGRTVTLGGVQYQAVTVNGRTAVTWREGGHTCVLVGSASADEMLALASWSSGSTSPAAY